MHTSRKGTRFTVYVPTDLLNDYRAMAEEAKVSISSLIVAAARRAYRKKRGKK